MTTVAPLLFILFMVAAGLGFVWIAAYTFTVCRRNIDQLEAQG